MSPQGPILIGGTGRSGTTALARALGFHPHIRMLKWEAQFLSSPNGLVNLVRKGFPEQDLAQFVDSMRGRWFRRTLRPNTPNEYDGGLFEDIDEEAMNSALNALDDMVSEGQLSNIEIGQVFVETLLQSTLDTPGIRSWGEKTPRNVLFVDLLWEMFPTMRFIHIIRDGRDVATSMESNGFWPIAAGWEFPELSQFRGDVVFEMAFEYWRVVLDLARRAAASVPDANYFEVRYEDLASNPEDTMAEICDFIDLPYTSELAEFDFREAATYRWKRNPNPRILDLDESSMSALAAEGYQVGW